MNAHFEHIAFAIHGEDIGRWDQLLRGTLGGDAGLGGDAEGLGFRGGQILYPNDGMLEVISWQVPGDDKNPIKRYVERHGPRAALHHLTFTVDDFDSARARCEEQGYDVMPGRYTSNWKELYLRAPFLEPAKMLIQILQTDKDAMKSADGWDFNWDAFAGNVHAVGEQAVIVGATLAASDETAAERMFCDLLGATRDENGIIGWAASSMTIRLVPGGGADDSHVAIEGPVDALAAEPGPAGRLIRAHRA
jgi:hypothetical protein